MRSQPAFTTNLGSSHGVIYRVDLHTASGVYLGTLPIESGDITEVAGEGWTGSLTILGSQWIPHTPADPLSGFTGAYVRVYTGQIVDQEPAWLELAQLIVVDTQVKRSVDDFTITVQLADVLAWVAPGVDITFKVELGQTCQQAIRQIITRNRPPAWPGVSFVDTTPGVQVPAGYAGTQAGPLGHVANLSAIANVNVRPRWDRTIAIEPPRGQSPGSPVRTLTTARDIVEYDVMTGRDTGSFANRVELTFTPLPSLARASFASTWTRTGNPPHAGQMRISSDPLRLVLHRKDSAGRRRQRVLERIESGDLLTLRATNGWDAVYRATSGATFDDDTERVTVEVELIDTDGTDPGLGATLEVAWYASVVDEVVGVAEQTSGPLGSGSVGRVTYTAAFDGAVTQAQANARAAQVLPRMLAGWTTIRCAIIPDPRIEVGDTVTVEYLDGTRAAHRVTETTWPLTPDEPMRLGLRTFDLGLTKGL